MDTGEYLRRVFKQNDLECGLKLRFELQAVLSGCDVRLQFQERDLNLKPYILNA